MEREETIDLKDLCYHLLLRWRAIIAVGLIFAILGGIYGAVSSYRAVKTAEAQLAQTSEETDYSQYEANLSEVEIEQVDNAVEDYIRYEEKYEESKEYYESSIKMQLNPNEVVTDEAIYRITGHESTKEILELYREKLLTEELCQQMIEANGWDIEDTKYVRELISISRISIENSMGAEIEYQNDAGLARTSLDIDDDNSDLLSIRVMAATEEESHAISQLLQDAMPAVTEELQEEYGQFDMEMIDESVLTGADSVLLAAQQSVVKEINNISNLMKAQDDPLTEEQKEYFNVKLADAKMDETVAEEPEAVQEPAVVVPSMQYINLKEIILGAIVGVFLVCFYLACRYVMNGRLNTPAVLTEESGNTLLGTVYTERKKRRFGNGIDALIIRLFKGRELAFGENERLQMIGASIQAAVRKDSMKNLYLSSTVKDAETERLLAKIEKQIAGEEVNVRRGESVLHSAESLEQLTLSQGAVFVEQIGSSFTQDVWEEIQICRKNGIPILGFVIVDTLDY